jgi:hypothetical protein
MSETTRHTPENHDVDWRSLADELFPAEALRTTPTVNPPGLLRNSFWLSAN